MKRFVTLLLLLAVTAPAMAQDALTEWKGKEVKVAPVSKDGKAQWTIAVENAQDVKGSISLSGKVTHKTGAEGKLHTCLLSPKGSILIIEDSKGKVSFLKGRLSDDLIFTGTPDKRLAALMEARLAKEKSGSQ
jgi:hypothetical protein